MKIVLRFQHYDSPNYPCACLVDTENKPGFAYAVAKTWAEAEAEAIAKAKAMMDVGEPPQDKEITI